MRALRSAALLAAIACLSAGPSAQGLADAARRASAAPQQPATKKYTNDDVETAKPVAPPAPAAAPSEAAAEAPTSETAKNDSAKTAGAAAPAAAEEVKATDPEPKKTPQYILNRIAQLKAQLSNKEKQLRDMQAGGAASDAALVTKQIANVQEELKVLEARLSGRD